MMLSEHKNSTLPFSYKTVPLKSGTFFLKTNLIIANILVTNVLLPVFNFIES